jgi:hypothetical protein
MIKPLIIMGMCVTVAGCAGRKADPVSVVQGYDHSLTCADARDEIKANEARINQLHADNDKAHNSNIAWGVVGTLLFWPAYFAIDDGNAESTEIAALQSRNDHLLTLSTGQACDGIKTVVTTPNGVPTGTYNNGPLVTGDAMSPQAWAAVAPKKACKLANSQIVVKTEDDCKAAGGQPAPF